MAGSRWNLSLPLLTRELTVQAARRRTYVLRVLLGMFAGWFGLIIYDSLLARSSYSGSPLAAFGGGDDIYDSLTWIQFGVIYLLLPLQSAGLLTEEKERDTLQLLLITQLGPWKILIEKLLSRVVPMSALLLVCLPLQAFAYGLGGVPSSRLILSTVLLTLTMFQMASLGLVASSFHRTTGRATVGTIGLVVLSLFGPGLAALLIMLIAYFLGGNPTTRAMERVYTQAVESVGLSPPQSLFPFFGGLHYQLGSRVGLMRTGGAIASCLLVLSQSLAMLCLARYWLWRRASLSDEPVASRRGRRKATATRLGRADTATTLGVDKGVEASVAVSGVDRTRLATTAAPNQDATTASGVTGSKQNPAQDDLADTRPVAWREQRRNRQSWPGWLFALLPILAVPLGEFAFPRQEAARVVQYMLFFLYWITGLLRVVVVSTGLYCGERSRQSLDVLRTLPLTGSQLTREKLRGLWPLGWVYGTAITLNSVCGARFLMMNESLFRGMSAVSLPHRVGLYLMNALLVPAIDLALIACVGCLISLKIKSHQRAIWMMLGLILAWMIGPYLIAIAFTWGASGKDPPLLNLAMLISPAFFPVANEFNELQRHLSIADNYHTPSAPWPLLVLSLRYLLAHGTLLLIARLQLSRVSNQLMGGPDCLNFRKDDDSAAESNPVLESPTPAGSVPAENSTPRVGMDPDRAAGPLNTG